MGVVERGQFETAVEVYRGPFLQGFHLTGAGEFERWVETQRAGFASEYRRVLESLATKSSSAGRVVEAVHWWRLLATEDRYGSRAALGLLRALVESGDRAAALEFARVHERIVRTELETVPDPDVSAFVNSLREAPRRSVPRGRAGTSREIDATVASVADEAGPRAVAPRPPHRGRSARVLTKPVLAAVGVFLIVGASALSYAVVSLSPTKGVAFGRTPPRAPPRASNTGIGVSARLPGRETANVAAHEFYERGRDMTLLRSDSGVRVAISYLERAVALDTNYASAYAALASRYATAAFGNSLSMDARRSMHAHAVAAARRAVALDDSLAAAHAELGYTLVMGFDPRSGAVELERAIALDPDGRSTPELFDAVPLAYEWLGRPDDALTAARRLLRADSLSAPAHAELGHALFFAGRYAEALAEFAKLRSIQPQLRRVPEYTAQVYAATGRWSDAIAVLRPVAERQSRFRGLLGYALARSGQRDEARKMLTSMLADESTGSVPAWAITEIYVGLRDYDRAFVWLDRSIDDYSLGVVVMGPGFDDLRADPRFERVRRRLHLAGS
jgi:DNA-binding SARP family transcriptional activator